MSIPPDAKPAPKPSATPANVALLLSLFGSGCLFMGPWGVAAGVLVGLLSIVDIARHPGKYTGRGRATAAVVIGLLGLVYWRAVGPYIDSRGELRSRLVMNRLDDSRAIGELRSLASGEAYYADSNAGLYDTPACLAEPRKCIPGAPDLNTAARPGWESTSGGYVFTFHPGEKPTPAEIKAAKASPSSMKSFAARAIPVTPGSQGRRAFCIDASGVIRFTADGSPPPIADGACAATSEILK